MENLTIYRIQELANIANDKINFAIQEFKDKTELKIDGVSLKETTRNVMPYDNCFLYNIDIVNPFL